MTTGEFTETEIEFLHNVVAVAPSFCNNLSLAPYSGSIIPCELAHQLALLILGHNDPLNHIPDLQHDMNSSGKNNTVNASPPSPLSFSLPLVPPTSTTCDSIKDELIATDFDDESCQTPTQSPSIFPLSTCETFISSKYMNKIYKITKPPAQNWNHTLKATRKYFFFFLFSFFLFFICYYKYTMCPVLVSY